MSGNKIHFTLHSVTNGCRSGSLRSVKNNITVDTPTCMLYTKAGSAPHLGKEVLHKLQNIPKLLHIPLSHFAEFSEILEDYAHGLRKFTANEDFLLYTSIYDPMFELPSGFNDKNSIALWGRGGKIKIDAEKFCKLTDSIQPDMYEVMYDCDTNKESTQKRIGKSADNTLKFLDTCLQKHDESQRLKDSSLFGVVGGGFNQDDRVRWTKELVKRPVAGYVFEGFHHGGPDLENFSFQEIVPLLMASMKELSEDKPRIMHHIWSPDNVLRGVEVGIDIFDSSYPYIVTERGGALNFQFNFKLKQYQLELDGKKLSLHDDKITENRAFELNLNDKRFACDRGPIMQGCTCYTCKTHSRAYINHLLNTSELLSSILLMIHNFHHYFEFFGAIRESLHDGTFKQLQNFVIK